MSSAPAPRPPLPLLRRVRFRARIHALGGLTMAAVVVITALHLHANQLLETALLQTGLADTPADLDGVLATLRADSSSDLAVGCLLLLILSLAAVALARSITVPMQEVLRVADQLAQGQRAINGPTDQSPDEAGQLLRTLYHLDDALRHAEEDMEHRAGDLTITNDHLETQALELAVKTQELEQANRLMKQAEKRNSRYLLSLSVTNETLEVQALELATKTQELEHARAAADAANLSKTQFLSNMSHEIRTPMTAIMGYADLLQDESLSNAHRREHLDTIRRNGEHLLTIINDILDVSKIEAGQMTVEHIETDPMVLLHQCIDLLQVRTLDTEVDLRLEPVYPLPAVIETDPVRLRQIVLNLVGNAIKFSPHGLVVVTPSFDADNQQLRIDVRDTGIGMTPDQLARLFQPFTQADVSTTRRFGGTGLGLTISRRLAEMLGGTITVTSRHGQGSTFTATVATGPVDPAFILHADHATPPPIVVPAAPPDPPTLAGHVLLAEDGPDNQRLISFILQKAGLTVDLAEDGRQALDQLTKARETNRHYDAVLMDMQMPRLDGLAATKAARQLGYTGPIIGLTAHASEEARGQAIDAGCTDFATKPIDRAALLELLQHHLQRRDAA